MKEKETYISCGMTIKNARLQKEKSVSELAFEIARNKDDTKLYIKKINMWEKEKDYPNLDEIYLLAYALEINPTDLMILRDRHRKNFVKSSKTKKKKKVWCDWEEVMLELRAYFSAITQLFAIFAVCYIGVQFARLEGAVNGPPMDAVDNIVGEQITDFMNEYEGNTSNSIDNTENVSNILNTVNANNTTNTSNMVENSLVSNTRTDIGNEIN